MIQDSTPRALLIGINRYPLLQGKDLHGCVNDVEVMSTTLQDRFGFAGDDVTVLRDDEATRDGILGAMDTLVGAAREGDVVVIHYSGHGSRMTDREGDEPDGMDETIVPYDSGRGADENRDITDDEIHSVLRRLTGVTPHVTLIFDSCHSGTISRDPFASGGRWIPPDTRPASELPPSPLGDDPDAGIGRAVGPSGWLPLGRRYVLLAGCRDEESSYEHEILEGGEPLVHGALTYFVTRELLRAGSGATYRDVFELAALQVTAHHPRQHPQIEGARDRELFGVRDLDPVRFVSVASRAGNAISLRAGAAHGMTVGSRWTVHPPGTKRPDPATALASAEVTAVGATACDAQLEDESTAGAVAAGARAVEAEHDYRGFRLAVEVRADPGLEAPAQELADKVETSSLLTRQERGPGLCAYALQARTSVPPGSPVPQLPVIAEPVWAVVAEDGGLAMSVVAVREGVAAVVKQLERLAKHRAGLAIENTDPDNPLAGKVELRLKRRGADGWVDALPDEHSGEILFEEGDLIGAEVVNRHTAPIFVSLLDFGLTGAVGLLHPVEGASEALEPGIPLQIGMREGEEMPLGVPPALPFAPGERDAGGVVSGRETFKLFVTTREADFSPLVQEGVRGGKTASSDHPLTQLVEVGLTGTRDVVRPVAMRPEDHWTTVSASFVLSRPSPAVPLRPDGGPVQLGDAVLYTAGLSGTARVQPPSMAPSRSRDLARADLEDALAAAQVRRIMALEIDGAQEVAPATRSTLHGEAAVELEVAPPEPGQGQFVLATDEAGVVTWNFATGDEAARGDAGARVYRIRRRVVDAPEGDGARGLAGLVGQKLLKVLVFPLLDPLLGEVGEYFAGRWEARRRPYRVRGFSPEDYRRPDAAELDREGWARLSTGPALLFVHGTFSRAHSAFGGLSPESMSRLHAAYDGRVAAFDHYTLSEDPRRNVQWLLDRIPKDASLELDIVCHSRGGLVSRVLAERQHELRLGSRQISVRRVVFVGTPNAGTVLADAGHLGDLIDTYTNLFGFFPDNGVTEVLETVITVAKQLAVGAIKGLDGLRCMVPDGDFLQALNYPTGPVGEYCALAADFQPKEKGLATFIADRLVDRIFRNQANDMVVPSASVWDGAGGAFPIATREVLETAPGVAHTQYFADARAQERLVGWLATG